jgi:hypothetical protein
MPDPKEDIFATLQERYRHLCIARDNTQQNIERLQTHHRELMGQIKDCFAVARVFDRDLCSELRSDPSNDLRRPKKSFHSPSINPRQALTIRGLVLDAVERAYPNCIRASDIQRQLLDLGYETHEKTVGMTLYRWSLENRVRREGRMDWYFVPLECRLNIKVNKDHDELAPALKLLAPLGAVGDDP